MYWNCSLRNISKIASFWMAVFVVCVATFPIYTLLAVDEVYSNVYYDALFGNILFGLVLVWGGRYTLWFGSVVAFQRILEILTVQIWGGGVFSAGITRQAFIHFKESSTVEIWGYVQLLYPYLIVGFVIIVAYMFVYTLACKKIVAVLDRRRKQYNLVIKGIYVAVAFSLVQFAWGHRVRTDIFFFENNNDIQINWLMADNTYSYVSKPVSDEEKIDLYFIVGESASEDHMSLYGYKRKTNPYLESLASDDLTVFKGVISPASSTFASYEIMFSRSTQTNEEMFFLSPNLIEELNHMGYKSVWQSYHPARRSFVYESLVRSVDKFYSSNDNRDDRKMIEMLSGKLEQKPTVYFINMFGSHPYYDVPGEQKVFSKHKNSNAKKDTINRYDDTILALDSFVKDTVVMAEKHKQKTGRDYAIWYTSDHGQVLYNNGSDWAGHSTNANGTDGYRIPFFIIGKKALPCASALPKKGGFNSGRVFDLVLMGLCGVNGYTLSVDKK